MKSIIEAIATTNERDFLLDFLDQLREKSYNLSFDVKSVLKDVPQHSFSVVSEIFESAIAQGRDAWMREIDRAQEDIRNMQMVTITIPIEPNLEFAWKIKLWFREMLKREVMIDFRVDKSIIGGAVIESNGYRTEHSFRQYFESKQNTRN